MEIRRKIDEFGRRDKTMSVVNEGVPERTTSYTLIVRLCDGEICVIFFGLYNTLPLYRSTVYILRSPLRYFYHYTG